MAFGLQFGAVLLSLPAPILDAYQDYSFQIQRLLRNGEIEKAKVLLRKDPDLKNARDGYYRRTPLHVAAWEGQFEMVKLLLELGAEVNARDNFGHTPLHDTREPEIAKLLIAHKANMEAIEFAEAPLRRITALSLHSEPATAQKMRAIARILLDAGAHYDVFSATYLDDVNRVKAILKDDPKQASDKDLLGAAAQWGRAAIVKQLLDHEADPNSESGNNPVLYYALQHPDIVRLLIKAGADPKVPATEPTLERWGAHEKMPLLYHAAQKGLTETAKLLLEGGAEVESRSSHLEWTPLYVAAKHGHPEVVKLLLKYKASVRGEEGRRAMDAALSGVRADRIANYRVVITLLGDAGVPINLYGAVLVGDVNRIQKLLKDNPALASSNDDGRGPILVWAVELNQKEMVAALLDAGVPINGRGDPMRVGGPGGLGGPGRIPGGPRRPPKGDGSTALHVATQSGREEIAKLLVERKADVNVRNGWGATPLHNAARWNNSTVVKLLLNAGADVKAKDSWGQTPFHVAVGGENADFVKLFLKTGVDVNVKDGKGRTPLHNAALFGKASVVKVLLEAGADVNAKDNEGTTPLHDVAGQASPSGGKLSLDEFHQNTSAIAKLLLDAKADVNAKDNDGATPLHRTAVLWLGSEKMTELLLAAGADVNARDNFGQTPLAWSTLKYNKQVIQVLMKHGGEK